MPHTASNVRQEDVTASAQNKEGALEKRVFSRFGDQAEVEACRAEQSTDHLRTDSTPYQSGTSDGYENLFLEK